MYQPKVELDRLANELSHDHILLLRAAVDMPGRRCSALIAAAAVPLPRAVCVAVTLSTLKLIEFRDGIPGVVHPTPTGNALIAHLNDKRDIA